MIGSFKNALSVLLKNPLVLVPAFVSAVIAVFLSDIVSWPMLEMLYEFAIELKGMQLGFFEMIVAFYQLYAGSLLFLSIVFFAAMTMLAVLLFFYSKYAMHYSEKDAFSNSLKYALERIPRAAGFVVFAVLSAFLAAFTLFAVILFVPMDFMLSTILFSLLAIISAFIFLKLFLFAVPAIVLYDSSVRKGIAKSWNFTSKKLPESILALIIVFFTVTVITQIGVLLLEPLQEGIVTFIAAAIFNSFVFAFGSLFFAFYYFNNYSEAERRVKRRKKSK